MLRGRARGNHGGRLGGFLCRGWWLRRRGGGDGGGGLDHQVVDHGLDAGDLGDVAAGDGAGGLAGDAAAERDDAAGDGGLDGLTAEVLVRGQALLDLGVQAGGIRGRRGTFAACESRGSAEQKSGQAP